MSLSLAFCGLAVIIQLILGLTVLLRDFRRGANLVFSLQLFLFTLWSLAEVNQILNGTTAFSIKLLMSPAILLVYFFCIFSAIYPEYQKDAAIIRTRSGPLLFFLPAGLLLYLLWSDRLIAEFAQIHNGFTLSLGEYEFLAKGVVVAYLAYSLSTLSNSRKNAETKTQIRRLRYTFTAMLLPVAAGSIIIAAGKWIIGGNTAYTFGLFPVLSIAMSTMLGYTMLKYNLMEIDLMFSIGLVYTLLTAILAGCMELLQELLQDLLNFSDLSTKLISVLFIAAFFSPLKELLIKLVNHFFGRKSFDSASVMQHILAQMRRCESVEKMLLRLVQELRPVLDFTSCRISIGDNEVVKIADDEYSGQLCRFSLHDVPAEINDLDHAIDYFRNSDTRARCEEFSALREAGIRNFFRFSLKNQSEGLLLLGCKSTRVPYTETEISLVEGLSKEIPFLVENLQMIEKLLQHDRSMQEIEWAKKMLGAISVRENDFRLGPLSLSCFASLSQEIKGDLIDFCSEERQSFVALYDAFHHGIQAVLTLNLLFSVFRSCADTASRFLNANRVLQHFGEQQLCSAVTLLQLHDDSIEIFTAGNPSPLLIEPGRCSELQVEKTSPLGLQNKVDFHSVRLQLKPGQLLLLTTNGLSKAYADTPFSDLRNFLQQHTFSNPRDLRDKLIEPIKHLIKTNFSDDITFLTAGFYHEQD